MMKEMEDGLAVDGVAVKEDDNGKKYVVYQISWNERACWKRYREFSELHKLLMGMYPVQMKELRCRLPRKAVFNMKPEFIEERRVLLENYLRHVLAVKELAKSSPVKSFLQLEGKADGKSELIDFLGLSEDQVAKIVEQQKTKYQIEEDFDKFLRQVQDKDDPEADGEVAKFV